MSSSMKNAVLSPLLKKPSLDFEIFSNFRPVSNLKLLSKVIEKVAAMRLTNYLCDNDLNESLQSAYKKHHSCETALLRVQNDILKSTDDKQCVVLLLLDLSAAFDTVDHKILLHIIPSQFRLMDLPHQFVCSDLVYPRGPCWVCCCICCTRPHWVT